MVDSSVETSKDKLKCENYGVHCMNNAVGEADMARGLGVRFYCRECMTHDFMFELEDMMIHWFSVLENGMNKHE